MKCICPQCLKEFDKPASHVNRSKKIGAPVFCGKACFGLSRRLPVRPTEAERKAAKAKYDAEYRAKNFDMIKAKKSAYFQKTYDPAKAAVERKKNMHKHVEYCRRPEYKTWKSGYDRKYRATKEFGEFAEAALILQDVEKEVLSRSTRYEISLTNGTLNKAQKRRRMT